MLSYLPQPNMFERGSNLSCQVFLVGIGMILVRVFEQQDRKLLPPPMNHTRNGTAPTTPKELANREFPPLGSSMILEL